MLLCAQKHMLSLTHVHMCTHTHTHSHASLHHSFFPSQSALPAGGASWPPAPSSILPASLSWVPPYPSHLLISLLNSRRQRSSHGRGEMDGPGGGGEGPGRERWGGRSSGLLQPPVGRERSSQARGAGGGGVQALSRPGQRGPLVDTAESAWSGLRGPQGQDSASLVGLLPPYLPHLSLLPAALHLDRWSWVGTALSSCTPSPALTPPESHEHWAHCTPGNTHLGCATHHIWILLEEGPKC